jgi:acylphosphatase
MDTARVSRQVIYCGRVQGVGFRMTARSLARRFPVAGHVRNRPDGTVELVALGDAPSVRKFLDAVASAMGACIEHAEVTPGPPDYASSTFEIAD